MKPEINNNHELSRRKFLRTCGSVVAGGSILAVSGVLMHKILVQPENHSAGGNGSQSDSSVQSGEGGFKSPYKLASSFKTTDPIEGFEFSGDRLIVATSKKVSVYDLSGNLLHQFAAGDTIRDIVAEKEMIYVLYPTRIEVFSMTGERLREWEACSEESDYCSLAVAPGFVFVTDAANKNICKYTTEGGFVKFIQSPEGFIVPSYSFGITYANGSIFCSNPGRHKVENYTLEGEFIASFGKSGAAAGSFCGCCNPVYLSFNAGEIITSEKGIPRISCYSPEGEFRTILLDSKSLGGGNVAFDFKINKDKIYVAAKNKISTFQYDLQAAAETACSSCSVDCPLRKGINI